MAGKITKGRLIAVIGDKDTCTGFLLGGIGELNMKRQKNFFVVNKESTISEIEENFNNFVNRQDIAIILITQKVAEEIRPVIDNHTAPIPAILEIPSKDFPYNASKDSILKRAKRQRECIQIIQTGMMEKRGAPQPSKLYPSQQMIASSGGAFLVSLFTTPFEVVKVRLQAQMKPNRIKCSVFNQIVDTVCFCTQPPSINSPVLCTIGGHIQRVPRFASTTDAFIKIASSEGIPKLWKGLSPTLVQMVPQTVIYYTVYDQLKFHFGHIEGERSLIAPIASGVISRSFAVFCVSPIEMIKTKFQSKKTLLYRQLLTIVIDTIKKDGVASMWRGIGPTLLRDVPFSAIFWSSYETLKTLTPNQNSGSAFIFGAIAGLIAASATQPFDVIKTYRQIELGELQHSKSDSTGMESWNSTFSVVQASFEVVIEKIQ